ncbi:MAG: alpha-2-macroglobulin family protein, partial [Anaerolineae bacterium]
SFFEGSHVPGMELLVETDAGALPAVTDDSGRAVVAYTASTDPSRSSGYGQSWAAVRPARPEEGEITASASTLVFPAELALDLTSDVEGGIGRITGTVRLVDLSAPGAVEPQDYLGAPVAGRQVTAAITEVHYERVETGEFYDFVDKVVRKSYLYETVEEPGGEIRAVSDESGAFELLVPLASDISYTVDLSVADDGGRGTERTVYLSAGPGGIPSWETSWVTEHQDPYAEGDTVELTLERGGEPMPDGDRYLFLRARSGIRDYEVSTTPVISFVFGPDDVPNTHILGVSFNGATFSEAPWSYNARLDSATRELAIEVTTDRERYAPGDEVSVAVSTHGPDGEPVSAEVLLSGIDAAIRQMQADEPGTRFLDDLYASVAPGVVRTYSSHYYPIGQPGAEYGGGGDGARGWFEDVALFESVTTDASGRAETSFVVPDNLTSWVISALGLDEVMQAGYGVGEAPVGLPLFVDLTANDTYLASDEPVLRLRAYGEALDADDEVSFELYSETLMDEPLAVSGPANTGVEIPLSTEIGGEHVIAALATNGELEDVLERTITVLPSRLASAASSSAIVGVGEQYEPRPAGSRVSLTVSDANRGRYLPELALLATSQGDRLDQMVARLTAAELQRDQFPAVGSGDEQATAAAVASGGLSAVTAGSAAPPLQPYRTPDRGLALLPYGDADLRVSARVAAVAPAEAGRQGLVEYFTRVVDDDGETLGRVAEALHGLAALGEPVLPSVVSLLDAEGLEPRDALLLGIAAADLGDYDSAQRVYTELLAGHGQRRGATMRLNVDGDRDEVAEATALAAVLGAALGDDAAPRLHDYSAIASTTDYVPDLDNVDYLARALPRTASAPLEVAYTHLGERSSSDIGADQSLTLSLTPTELAELALEVVGGRAAVVATELVPLDVDQLDVDPAIGLSRSYSVEGEAQDAQGAPGGGAEDDTPGTSAIAASDAEPLVIGAGDLVRVTLDYELGEGAVEGCYQISDLLPSGLRAVSRPSGPYGYYDDGDIVYPYAVDGQRVSFCVHRDDRRSDLSYLARVVTTGRYAAEPAVISAMEAPESRAVSTASAIVIR